MDHRDTSARDHPSPPPPLMDRRRALAGMAGAGALGATAALLASDDADAEEESAGLPVLATGADWAEVLSRTPKVQLKPGATYTLDATVDLPSGCLIAGNGATVTVPDSSTAALKASDKEDVTITDVRFLGQEDDPLNTAMAVGHVGLRLSRCTDVRVRDCDFSNWRGAGIVVTGSASDDYYAYRVKLQDNSFHHCYFGVSTTDRSEFSSLTGSSFTSCRLAVWNSSGNWTINNNTVSCCYGAYYSFASTSPYGSLTSDNWSHGSLVGNTFNHATSGGKARWTDNASFPIGGKPRDPGSGVIVNGVLPPTFSGNTLWYTDITATDLQGTRWLLSGSTLSHLTITCTGPVPLHVAGTQSRTREATPTLKGNTKDLLPL